MWIKLLKAIEGKAPDGTRKTTYQANEVVEVDDAVGDAYILRGYAEKTTDPARAEIDQFRGVVSDLLRNVREQVQTTGAAVRPSVRVEAAESEDDKLVRTGAFQSLGHFAFSTFRGNLPVNPEENHLQSLNKYRDCFNRITRAASGMNEASDPDGALAIPPTYNTQIWERVRNYHNMIDEISLIPIGGNTWQMPADAETSRVDGQRRGGIQGFWEGEANQYQKSKPTFSDRYLRLKKVTVLVFVTNEQLDDAPGLEGYLNRVAPEEIRFKLNDGIVNGTGAGMPMGLLTSKSRVTVPKVTGQTASTIVGQNLINMWARLYAPCRANAAWYINQDTEPQIQTAALPTGQYSGQLIYMPAGGVSGSPYGTLYGRPVIPIEQCPTCGTEGDIILADLTQVLGIRKQVGLQQSMSIHLRFDYDETCFKFLMRMDAQPAWEKPLTPFKGTNTQGAIVTLATRS
jgi:HK97 family phage major capsid protein